ncbi:hypothetical protein OF820_01410 [Oceanotoga sp. DSM 15011]|uniref:hypothetical protein n=1 Tax=Oceanotoga sp. DSM 15011 TaxID=2984951 RepID=UPI0021F4B2FC|nr:hypothetical protein [Oceanotoga sp. DSM 15011]UYP00353.1 hypothetical protein OF820_01410 [Oceanotoga sp. DSM 15011]
MSNDISNEYKNIILPIVKEDDLIPKPCKDEIEKYLENWDKNEKYMLQENAEVMVWQLTIRNVQDVVL